AISLLARQAVSQTSDRQEGTVGAGAASQPQTLGDLARKGKQREQPDQSSSSVPANKTRVYSEDNVAAPRVDTSQAAKPNAQTPPAKQESKASAAKTPGAKAAIIMFKVEKSTVNRPSSTQVDWTIQNTSDEPTSRPYGPFTFTLTFNITGPCNYKKTT